MFDLSISVDFVYSVYFQMFKRLHGAYVDMLCNPFYIPGENIVSRYVLYNFLSNGGIDQSFGVGERERERHTHTHAHTHARMHARVRAHTHACTLKHTHTHTRTRTHMHTHTHTHRYGQKGRDAQSIYLASSVSGNLRTL